MLAKFSLFLMLGAAFFAGTSAEAIDRAGELEKLVEEILQKIKDLTKSIEEAGVFYDQMAMERIESLNYLHHTVSEALDTTNKNAVFKGFNDNKPFSSFECVVREADHAANKIKQANETFPGSVQEIKDKSTVQIEPFLIVTQNLKDFVEELIKTKNEEIKADPFRKDWILLEVSDILNFINGVLKEIEKKASNVKFSFFEQFVLLCYNTEQVYKKVQREDFPKILRCV